MSNIQEHPKMLYCSSKMHGTSPVFGSPGVFCAVAADADEEKAMLECGFAASITELKPADAENPAADTQRDAVVAAAKELGIKVGRKSVDTLKAEIAAKADESGD